MVPVCVILSLGFLLSLVLRCYGGSVPFGLGARLCFAKSNEKLFCEMMELPWCFLHGSWWVLVGFRLISKDFGDLAGSLGAADPPGGDGPVGVRFHYDLRGF